MTKEEHIKDLEVKSDFYISNMSKNRNSQNLILLDAIDETYVMRKLDSPEKQKLIANFPTLLENVKTMVVQGLSSQEIIAHLTSKGIPEIQAEEILKMKSKTAIKDVEIKKEGKGKTLGYILAVFIIIRLAMRFFGD